MNKMAKQITVKDLLEKKNEFVTLGSDLELFEREIAPSIEFRLADLEMVIDSSIEEDAIIDYENGGSPRITINVKRCNKHNEEYYLDKVIFHKLAHIVNEIQRELHVYKDKRIDRFKDLYSGYADGNETIKNPDRGFKILDEVISEYTSRAMVYRKYFMELDCRDIMEPTKYANPMNPVFDREENYNTYYLLANKFAQTIYRANDPMFRLCKDSFNHSLLENIFSHYQQRDNGYRELYEILGGMGNIFDIRSGKTEEEAPGIVSDSMKYVLARTEKVKNQ